MHRSGLPSKRKNLLPFTEDFRGGGYYDEPIGKFLSSCSCNLAPSDYSSSYRDLLQKTKFTTVHIHSIRQLVLEVFKTLHKLNPVFIKNYFIPKPSDYDLCKRDVLYFPTVKRTRYGIKSLRFWGPKMWNSLPDNTKLSNNINQ